ncbi:GNAT family N-acetyltransferase [Polluticoccus soli]|uniref:GNAT family N-acetyltransferase n=1 Tax=Polluticoccus soli TaxID=3034150 RepID=UPI0023E0D089|nr:GNAT family protein [Flavipsychrobacter sp. JY13-12]
MVSILIDNELLLRSFQPDDAPALFKAVDESRMHLRSWLRWVDATTKQEHILQFIQRTQQQLHNQQALELGIFHNRDIIGGIGMHDWDHLLKKAQLGYWIKKEYEGQGIINKCLVRFIDFLFEKPGLNKIEIHFMPANKRSAKVAERLGCKVEGVIRQSYFMNGRLEDLVITGLLKTEWKSPNN